jgi:rhamnosyl/mannosyltransferase
VLKGAADRIAPLPLGIDLRPYLEPSRAALEYSDTLRLRFGEPLWLAVGRLVYYKGFGTAIDALNDVPGTLLFVGTGPHEGALRLRAERRDVADRIAWMPRLSDDELVGAYLAATALWFPSNARSEAFGLTQVEAMACGCPVINTNIPHSGVAWVSRHEESGLTVPVDAPAEFAAAANRLAGEPGLRDRLAEGARRRAVAEFSAERMTQRSLAIYEELSPARDFELRKAIAGTIGGTWPVEVARI